MHPSTSHLARSVRSRRDTAGQLAVLRNAYEGQRCVIVTCGPSLADIDAERLRAALDGTLTIVVKQAIDAIREQADFLCFNSFNVTRYRTPSPNTIRCLVQEPTGRIPQFNRADLRFAQSADGGHLERSLAATHAFDDNRLTAGSPRPWGPGIMYELVLHLAVHLGVSDIVTVGWDIGNARGRNVHFYDAAVRGSAFDEDRSDQAPVSAVRRGLPGPVRHAARWTRALGAHARGQLYNRALPVEGEADLVASSTSVADSWLATNGIRLTVVTPSDRLDGQITRCSPDQLLERLSAR